jgi:hypothetical protein
MLEVDYTSRFSKLIKSIQWKIELPRDWADYFDLRGEMSQFEIDVRTNNRMMVRTYGVMWFDQSLPFCNRSADPVGIYSRDFSRQGVGLLSPFEIYPEERIRIALPAFWVEVLVVRARRITSKCYEIGTELIQRHDPDPAALMSAMTATV